MKQNKIQLEIVLNLYNPDRYQSVQYPPPKWVKRQIDSELHYIEIIFNEHTNHYMFGLNSKHGRVNVMYYPKTNEIAVSEKKLHNPDIQIELLLRRITAVEYDLMHAKWKAQFPNLDDRKVNFPTDRSRR